MKRAEEHEVFAAVVGSHLKKEKLKDFTFRSLKGEGDYADCRAYVLEALEEMKGNLIGTFRITDALVKKWKETGICFQLCLFVRDGVVIGGHIRKYKALCHDAGYETSPTRQEIGITARILKYLIEENLQ